MFSLRRYQVRAIEHVLACAARGTRRLLVVAPTGAGKATIAADLARTWALHQMRVLFVAHRRELIRQAYDRFVVHGVPEDDVGVIMASDPHRRPGAHVQVASIDTLRARTKPAADVVIHDECHRALAQSFRDLAAEYPDALHLGFTATPFRADGRGLGDAYGELFVVATPRELIEQGFLVEPRVFTVPADKRPDLSRVRVKRGDYDEKALAAAMDQSPLVGNIVEHWKKHAQGLRTFAFATSVAHSKHIVERFVAAGIAAEHLDANSAVDERDAVLARLARGETLVLANVGLFAEGTDVPSVKCAILARPTKSTGLYLQQVGRILRPWSGVNAVVLDHGGCVLEHGLPQEDRAFSLDSKPRRARDPGAGPPVRVCGGCEAVVPLATAICPECGAQLIERGARETIPEEAAGELALATEDLVRHAEWTRLCETSRERGYKPGWAYHQFRQRFGGPPPADWSRPPAPIATTSSVRAIAQHAIREGRGRLSWDAFG